MPEVRTSGIYEETGAADKRNIPYSEWFRLPRWSRVMMMARDRAENRLNYWLREVREHPLPPKVKPG